MNSNLIDPCLLSFREIIPPVYLIRAYFPEVLMKCSYRVNPIWDNSILSPMHMSLQPARDMSHQMRKYCRLIICPVR